MKRNIFVSIGICLTTLLSFVTVISSSLAWFAYSTKVTVQMTGTAVAKTDQLQIGLKTSISTFNENTIDRNGLEEVTTPSGTYTFAKPGTGFIPSLLQEYLSTAGYASTTLTPVTSREYVEGSDIVLNQSPEAGNSRLGLPALNNQFVRIPFAFRVVRVDMLEHYEPNQAIWITDALIETDYGEGIVQNAVRVHFDGSKYDETNNVVDNKFIFNPSALTSGYTNVSGLLNLNNDDYYDLMPGYADREMIYGDYTGTPMTLHTFDTDTDIDDINGTGNNTNITTFSAKHKANSKGYTSLEGITSKRANYKSMNEIDPIENEQGMLEGGQILTITSDDEYGIAELVATVYIEGWDHSVIDKEQNHGFTLKLTFQINRAA